ncbi:MAG: hypothetical protein WA951_10250 [Leeuwenhoekiella sp.]
MAPMKFEEQLKEKMAERTIEPSSRSWEMISGKLDSEPKKNNTKLRYWVGIAASFIGVLIVCGSLFFNTETNDSPTIVDTHNDLKILPEEKQQNKNLLKVNENESEIVENSHENSEIENGEPQKPTQFNTVIDSEKIESQSPVETLAAIEVEPEEIEYSKKEFDQTIDQEVDRLLAQVDSIKSNNSTVTDSQIESLLAQARENIIQNKIVENQDDNLSATALLQEVEQDLDRSFRDKVFDALKEGLVRAREAVATRNN